VRRFARVEIHATSHVRRKDRSAKNHQVNICPVRRAASRRVAASYFANAAATNPSDEVHDDSLRREGVAGRERGWSVEEEREEKKGYHGLCILPRRISR